MVRSIRSLTDLQNAQNHAHEGLLEVEVPGVDSIRIALKIYATIKSKMDMGHWTCNGIEKMDMLATVAQLLIEIDEDHIPRLTANYDDIGTFVDIYSAVLLLGQVSRQIGKYSSVEKPLKQLVKLIEDAYDKVENHEETMQWFVDYISSKVTNLLDLEVNFV